MASRLPFDADGIRYEICGASDIPDLVRTLAESFPRRDPLATAVGLTSDEFAVFLSAVTGSTAEAGLTIVARDTSSGAMAGALLVEDAATPAPVDPGAMSPKFGPIFELLGQLDDDRLPQPGQTLHVFLLGVPEPYGGRGIAHHLVQACLANAAERGYRSAIVEASGRVSQHVFGKLGFVGRALASYGDYHRDGVAVFAAVASHGGTLAMVRSLARDA